MKSFPAPSSAPPMRLDAELIEAARQRAVRLRQQAIDDALRASGLRVVSLLRSLHVSLLTRVVRNRQPTARRTACHS